LGAQLHSLSMLNMVSVASVQPMDKVKGLIKTLISKLTKEAADAASTHAWCEEENKKNKVAKKKTTDRLENLQLRADKANAKKAELGDNIQQLTEDIAEIDAADTEALEIRQGEHKNFAKSEADFKEAAAAVLDAIDALKDYYGETSLLQVETTTKSPIAFQAPDVGGAKQDTANGVLGILDTMADEFSKTVSELQSQERSKKKAYEKMKNDNAVSKASKQAEIKGASSEVQSLTVTAGETADDHAMTQTEMDALLEYIEKLKPTCVGNVMPYAQRKAKREAEIEGLKQAMSILEETQGTLDSASFMQVTKH
jgi:predicted  nucleic acid-binding Zn-ribbon protein